jgi:hypothetical protein
MGCFLTHITMRILLVCLLLLCTASSFASDKSVQKAPAALDVRSVESEVATEIQFVNQRDSQVLIYWVDFEGQRQLYSTLEPGEAVDQETYLTHPWLVTDAQQAVLGIYHPAAEARVVVID